MSGSSSTKRRRTDHGSLRQLLHVGGISRTGLAELMSTIRTRDVDIEQATAWRLSASEAAIFSDVKMEIQVPTKGGRTWLLCM